MKRFVLDTNTLLSALLWSGNESALVKHFIEGRALHYTSQEILGEVKNVLDRQKMRRYLEQADISSSFAIQRISSFSIILDVDPLPKTIVIKDPSDDKFLACAMKAKAGLIVSGDKHLLSIKKYKDIEIVTTTAALAHLGSERI